MGFLTGHELTWMPEALQILRDELPNIDVMISSQYSPQLADAFNVPLAELLAAGERLNTAGIKTQNFAGEETAEPTVIGWMPSAQLYFCDRDGHLVEFIALLDESPEPKFVGSCAWLPASLEIDGRPASEQSLPSESKIFRFEARLEREL